jgi:hypothetical protein
VRKSGITLTLIWHLGKWSDRLAFDDLHMVVMAKNGEVKSEEFITIILMLGPHFIPSALGLTQLVIIRAEL